MKKEAAVYLTDGSKYVKLSESNPGVYSKVAARTQATDFKTSEAAGNYRNKYKKLKNFKILTVEPNGVSSIKSSAPQAAVPKESVPDTAAGVENTTVEKPTPKNPAISVKVVKRGKMEEESKEGNLVFDIPGPVKRKVMSNEERMKVYDKCDGTCYICGKRLMKHEFTVEHKVPLSKGGTYSLDNLYCSCEMCNKMKGGYDYDDFLVQVARIAEYQKKEKKDKKRKKSLEIVKKCAKELKENAAG